MKRRWWVVGTMVLVAAGGGSAAQGAGITPRPEPLKLHLRFQRVSGGVGGVLASQHYLLALLGADWYPLGSGGYRVYDDARGTSWRIDTRPCGTASPARDAPYQSGTFGAPWILFSCSRGGFELYNVVERRWRSLGGGSSGAQAFRDAEWFEVGAHWIKLVSAGGQDCGDHIHYGCGESDAFYDIDSRTFRSSPTGPTEAGASRLADQTRGSGSTSKPPAGSSARSRPTGTRFCGPCSVREATGPGNSPDASCPACVNSPARFPTVPRAAQAARYLTPPASTC